jgi:hypothetical protein
MNPDIPEVGRSAPGAGKMAPSAIKNVAMSRPSANPTAQRMFTAICKSKEALGVVETLARAGDMEGLWAIIDSGSLKDAIETAPEVAFALRNLPRSVKVTDAEELEHTWFAAAGLTTPKRLAEHIISGSILYQVNTTKYAMKKGADPLTGVAWVKDNEFEYTLLGYAFAMDSAATAGMLEAVLESGRLPITRSYPDGRTKSLFGEMIASSAQSSLTRSLLGDLENADIPRAWACEIGRELHEFQADGDRIANVNTRPEHARMLALAAFDEPDRWNDVLYLKTVRELNTNALVLEKKAGPVAARIMRALVRDGLNPDEMVAAKRSNGKKYNFLQLAAHYDNPVVVEALLDLGGDPYRCLIDENGKSLNAFDLAPADSESARTLGAWRAKKAILDIAKKAQDSRP